MAQLKGTVITGGLAVSGGTNLNGAVQSTGDITLYQSGTGDSPAVTFQRGTLTDNYNDWRIRDSGGNLVFDQRGSASAAWSNIATLTTTGVATIPSVVVNTSATPTTGDSLVVSDSSSGDALRKGIGIDATDTSTFLRHDGTWANAGAASGDGFKITLTYNQDYTIDKTFAEVEAAVAANKYVYIYDATETQLQAAVVIGHYIGIGQGDYIFQCINDGIYVFYSIWNDNGQTKVNVSNYAVDSGQTTVRGTSPVSVSSVGNISTVSLSNGYGDTKNPYGVKAANTFLAGPLSGSDAIPSFRELSRADEATIIEPSVLNDPQMFDYIDHLFSVGYRVLLHRNSLTEGDYYLELVYVDTAEGNTYWCGLTNVGLRNVAYDSNGVAFNDRLYRYPSANGTLATTADISTPKYLPGETYRVGINATFAGLVTDSARAIIFSLHLPKSAEDLAVTVTNCLMTVRGRNSGGTGSYIPSANYDFTSYASATLDPYDPHWVRISCEKNSVWTNAVNNTPVVITPSLTSYIELTFS